MIYIGHSRRIEDPHANPNTTIDTTVIDTATLDKAFSASNSDAGGQIARLMKAADNLPANVRTGTARDLASPRITAFSVAERWSGRMIASVRDWMDRNYHSFRIRVDLTPLTGGKAISEKLAIRAFERTLTRVPAYEQFLRDSGVTRVRRWADVPIMTKNNYVKAYGVPSILVDGKIPAGQVDQSSGSTGKPSVWYRSIEEMNHTRTVMKYVARTMLGDIPASVINTFALGPWATGITVHNGLVDTLTMYAVGPDLDKATEAIIADAKMAKQSGEKRAQIVVGYPPFLKTLGDRLHALEQRGEADFSSVQRWAIGGGEAMSPSRREQLIKAGFANVRSSYGASDLTISVGVQDAWTVALEDACAKDPVLAENIFGRAGVPTILHYDPNDHYIEVSPVEIEGRTVDRLLFTQLSNTTCPKIRYDLGDEGGVRTYAEMHKLCERYGVRLPPRSHGMPTLFVWGRAENAVAYCGSKITPDHLLAALSRATDDNGTPLADLMENCAFNTYEKEGVSKLRFLIELKEGLAPTVLPRDACDRIITAIGEASQDFAKAVEINGRNDIAMMVFERGTGPNFHPNPNTKKKYIFQGETPV